MKEAFVEALIDAARKDEKVIFLTGDLGYEIFDDYKKEFPSRYINVGVAESQMMLAATGLALEGYKPICYSIAAFATARCYEQIRTSVSYHGLPIVIVGAGGGLDYWPSGPTHFAMDDIGLMSMTPGMTVCAPGSPSEVTALIPQLLELKGPSYIRIGRGCESNYAAPYPVKLGKSQVVATGEHIALATTGKAIHIALDAYFKLAGESKMVNVIHFPTVHPFDSATLDKMENIHTIICVEEHFPIGGLYSALCQWRAPKTSGPRILRRGPVFTWQAEPHPIGAQVAAFCKTLL